MYLVHLIQLVVAWKQREQCEHFEHDTPNAPIVHLMVIVAVSQQAFRRPVPPRRYVFCEGRLRIYPSAGSEVCQFHLFILNEDILSKRSKTVGMSLRLNVSVENTIFVHVVDRFKHLVHVKLNSLLWQVSPPAFYRLIHVHIHQFED